MHLQCVRIATVHPVGNDRPLDAAQSKKPQRHIALQQEPQLISRNDGIAPIAWVVRLDVNYAQRATRANIKVSTRIEVPATVPTIAQIEMSGAKRWELTDGRSLNEVDC